MMTGIALVTLYGYPALLSAQADANIRNMERNMIVLQSDINALVYKSVPYKETTMQVSGGVLSVESPNSASSFFLITDSGNQPLLATTLFPEGKFPSGELHFLSDSDDIYIGLENGAVVKHQTGGSVMLSKPRWFNDTFSGDDTLVITLIQVDTSGSSSANSGISSVQMSIQPLNVTDPDGTPDTGDETNTIDKSYNDEDIKIGITLADKFHKSWENYFENDLEMKQIDSITWEKEDVDRIIIKAWKIIVINL